MSEIVVLFKSKYGSTRKYAKTLSEKLNCEAYDIIQAPTINFDNYNTIIFGGSIYAGMIKGIKEFKKIFNQYPTKKFVLFTCGLSDPKDPETKINVDSSISRTFSPAELNKLKTFHVRGSVYFDKLKGFDKFIMKLALKSKSKENKELSPEDKKFVETKTLIINDSIGIENIVNYVINIK